MMMFKYEIYIYVFLWVGPVGIYVSGYLVHLTHGLFFQDHMVKLLSLLHEKSEMLEPLALVVSPMDALTF